MNNPSIHPSTIIEKGAQIGGACQIGPYCHIGSNVTLGTGSILYSHVVLNGYLSIGGKCEIFPFACLGTKSQDIKHKGKKCYVRIGDRTIIREYVTVNSASYDGDQTIIGNDCFILSYCHIAHDCKLGDHVIMSSGAMLAGHVEIEDYAMIGGMVGVVQFRKIGTLAMIGGYSKVDKDVLPFTIADGNPARMRTINKIGMKRVEKSIPSIQIVHQAIKRLLSAQSVNTINSELQKQWPESKEIQHLLTFIHKSKGGLARGRTFP